MTMALSDREPALWAAAILAIFALFILGFPLRFDGAWPWEMLNV